MAFAAVAAIAAPIIGGMLGNSAAKKDRERAAALSKQAMDAINGVYVPTVEEQKVILEELRRVGLYTPEMEQAYVAPDSEMKEISTDPRMKQAQLNSLLKLQEIGNDGGMSMEDKARSSEMLTEVANQERGQRDAIMQNMAQRGMSGSGFDLAAQLSNSQGAASRASQQGMDIKAQAERRALEALMSAGTLGGQMQNQDFSQQAQVAQAQDAINKFNTMNRQDVQSRNVQEGNAGQKSNLSEDQRIADGNVGSRNTAQIYNKGLVQQKYQNDMGKAQSVAGQYNNMAGQASANADRTAAMYSGIGQGVGQAASSYAQYQTDEERLAKYGRK